MFDISDIDVAAGYMSDPQQSSRLRPSPAEFFAKITVDVVTNLDLAAESRARPRGRTRPDASEFVVDEHDVPNSRRAAEGAEAEDGAPAGDGCAGQDPELQAEEYGKRTEPLYPIPDADVQRVSFYTEIGVAPRTRAYRDSFLAGFAKSHDPRWTSTAASRAAVVEDYCDLSSAADFEMASKAQDELFRYDTAPSAGAACSASTPATAAGVGAGAAEEKKAAADLVREERLLPREYAKKLMEELATREEDPINFGDDQKHFIALVVSKVHELWQSRGLDGSVPSGRPVRQCMVLLHGEGCSGKTEVVALARRIVEKFLGPGRDAAMASSNSAARVVGGDTVHSSLHMNRSTTLTLKALGSLKTTDAFIDKFSGVDLLVVDEISMVAPKLLGALSYRLCCARKASTGEDPNFFCEPGSVFGAIPIVVVAGDFLQLPPFDGCHGRTSLMKEPPVREDAVDKNHLARQAGYHARHHSPQDFSLRGQSGQAAGALSSFTEALPIHAQALGCDRPAPPHSSRLVEQLAGHASAR